MCGRHRYTHLILFVAVVSIFEITEGIVYIFCIHEFSDDSKCPHTKERFPDANKVPQTTLLSLI